MRELYTIIFFMIIINIIKWNLLRAVWAPVVNSSNNLKRKIKIIISKQKRTSFVIAFQQRWKSDTQMHLFIAV